MQLLGGRSSRKRRKALHGSRTLAQPEPPLGAIHEVCPQNFRDFRHPLPLCLHFQYCLSAKLADFWTPLPTSVRTYLMVGPLPYASKERVISILLNEKPNFLETLFRPRRLPAAALDQGLLCTTSVTGTSSSFVIMY